MATHRAIVLASRDKPTELQTVGKPVAIPGTAVVKILASAIASYTGDVLDGTRMYGLDLPMTLGCSAIGRIESVGA